MEALKKEVAESLDYVFDAVEAERLLPHADQDEIWHWTPTCVDRMGEMRQEIWPRLKVMETMREADLEMASPMSCQRGYCLMMRLRGDRAGERVLVRTL